MATKNDKIKRTFKELRELDNIIGMMFGADKNLPNTKFGYGYKRFYTKNLADPFTEYQNEIQDVWADHAMIDDKTKVIVRDEGKKDRSGFGYDREGDKNVRKAEKKLYDKWAVKEIEVDPYFIDPKDLPELNEFQKEAFKGLIMK